MRFDCFLYNGEESLLRTRLTYLDSVVDRFILVECTCSFQGRERTNLFDIQKFDEFADKIMYVKLPFSYLSGLATSRQREVKLRNAIYASLVSCSVQPNDVVHVSDVDEIPRRHVFNATRFCGIRFLKQHFCYFYANYVCYTNDYWASAFITQFKFLGPDLDAIRFSFIRRDSTVFINNGGWHFSYFGGLSEIRNKLESIGDNVEAFSSEDDSYFLSRIKSGSDIFGRRMRWITVSPQSLGLSDLLIHEDYFENFNLIGSLTYKLSRIRILRIGFRIWLRLFMLLGRK